MTRTSQLGESQGPSSVAILDVPQPRLADFSGLLGNLKAQGPRSPIAEFREDELWLWRMLNERFGEAHPASRLAILKRQKFSLEGREQRIAASLAALDAAQPTVLRREEWIEIAEEIEDDED